MSTDHGLLPALGRLPGHLFWRAQARVSTALADTLPLGTDIHAYAALLALSGGATHSQQAVAELISVSRTTMAKVAADLADQGLVERVRNPDDRRSWSLTRTREGANAARRWRRLAEEIEEALTPGFTADERQELRTLLLRMAEQDLAPDAPEPLRASIGFLVTRVHSRMHREFLVLLEPLRIEPSYFGTLIALSTEGPMSQADLARTMGVSSPYVVHIVDGLEERGLVVRRRLPGDRRTQVLHLTAEAPDVLAEATALAAAKTDQLMVGLGATGKARLLDLVRRLVTAP